MIWFYKRINTEDARTSTILCNTGMYYFRNIIAIVGIGACFLNQVVISAICLAILGSLLLKFIYGDEEIIKEIKAEHKAIKDSEYIRYSGSKYSFKNPLTIMIDNKKHQLKHKAKGRIMNETNA